MSFTWIETTLKETKFLSPLKNLLDEQELIHVLVKLEKETKIDRKKQDGIWTVKGKIHGQDFAILYNDFRVNGGSFGVESSKRIISFIKEIKKTKTPLIFALSSIGVRIMEGRQVFLEAFNIIPTLKEFIDTNLLITCTIGRCLGLGALFYELGDIRLAIEGSTLLNLTGPEVFKLFFGKSVDFEEMSSAKRQFSQTDIIQELYPTKEDMFLRIKNIVAASFSIPEKLKQAGHKEQLIPLSRKQIQNKEDLQDFLKFLAGSSCHLELFEDIQCSMKCYIINHPVSTFGLVINPPGKANMIDVKTIKKYRNALNLFNKLKLPLISVVDTSGADPRIEQNDLNIISELNDITIDIINYPHPKVGIINGRCFGGASVLTLPSIFGGERAIAIKGAQMGIMHHTIIRQLLGDSERLLSQWEENSAKETEDLADLVEQKALDTVITKKELYAHITQFLVKAKLSQASIEEQKDFPHFEIDTNSLLNGVSTVSPQQSISINRDSTSHLKHGRIND